MSDQLDEQRGYSLWHAPKTRHDPLAGLSIPKEPLTRERVAEILAECEERLRPFRAKPTGCMMHTIIGGK